MAAGRIAARVSALWIFAAFSVTAAMGGDCASAETKAQSCMRCHGQHGHHVTFENKETIEAYVDEEKFQTSVHRSLTCSQCHPEFSDDRHPQRSFRSKAQFQTKASLVCRRCHQDSQLGRSSIHAALLKEEGDGRPAVCTHCHGSHAIVRVARQGRLLSEEAYCLKCHGRPVTFSFANGERRSKAIDFSALEASVHDKLACSDCHYGFSPEEHPQRHFRTSRDYTLAASDSCRRCHFDKYTKTMESIHYAMLSAGNLKAPVCIDCHGAHSITRIGHARALSAKRCQKCHSDIYDIYAKSVHGSALFNENNKDVPVCVDCHTAHTIVDPRTTNYREKIPDLCSNCHANKEIMGKYGLSTDVLKTYLADFHGVTLSFYRIQKDEGALPLKPMAVCTDCHGTHNISSTVGPDANIVKANLVRKCQRCHAKADENFPDTWLSHYEPSMTRSPLVFFVSLLYRFLLPVMAAGLVLQVLLHIWRYVVDR